MQRNIMSVNAKKIFINNTSIVSTSIHNFLLYVIFLSFNIATCHIYFIFPRRFGKFHNFCASSFRDLFLFTIHIIIFVSHKSIIWHSFSIHTSRSIYLPRMVQYSKRSLKWTGRNPLGWSYWAWCFLWYISQNLRETFFWDTL